jgi:hypothetical protein
VTQHNTTYTQRVKIVRRNPSIRDQIARLSVGDTLLINGSSSTLRIQRVANVGDTACFEVYMDKIMTIPGVSATLAVVYRYATA